MLDVGEEARVIDRPVEDGGRPESLDAEGGDDGMGVPVPEGRVIAQTRAAGTPTVASEQIGRDAAFVEEDVLGAVAQRLSDLPLSPRRDDIRPTLFVGEYRFF